MGKYVGTLVLLLKHDLPRLIAVFAVINFSFGTGLYFTLVGHYNNENVDIVNENSTRYEFAYGPAHVARHRCYLLNFVAQ